MEQAEELGLPIKTERLTLRPVVVSDAERVALLANDRDIARFTARLPYPYRLEDAIEWISGIDDSPGETLAIQLDGDLIGVIGYEFSRKTGLPEIGYWLGKAWHGKGYATEAGRAVVTRIFARHDVDRITVGHAVDNPGSQRVIEKLGFKRAGTRVLYSVSREAHFDCLTYELSRSDAEAQGLL